MSSLWAGFKKKASFSSNLAGFRSELLHSCAEILFVVKADMSGVKEEGGVSRRAVAGCL